MSHPVDLDQTPNKVPLKIPRATQACGRESIVHLPPALCMSAVTETPYGRLASYTYILSLL